MIYNKFFKNLKITLLRFLNVFFLKYLAYFGPIFQPCAQVVTVRSGGRSSLRQIAVRRFSGQISSELRRLRRTHAHAYQ